MQNVSSKTMGWRPAPFQAYPTPFRSKMGQLPSVPASTALLDDPLLAATVDIVATSTSAYLAWGMAKAQSPWAPLWLVLATAMGVKTLHDFSRVKN